MADVTSLNHKPDGKWAFDESTANCFDDMLRRSIPNYDGMRDVVWKVGRRFCGNGKSILDLGCSHGEALAPFVSAFGNEMDYRGVDVSEPMLSRARKRFADQIEHGSVSIDYMDLRYAFPAGFYALVLAVLTVQFIPIEYRQSLIRNVYESLDAGGAMIFVEKILGDDADVDGIFVDEYLQLKEDNGYSREQITEKRLSLKGVLVPLTARWNEAMLRAAGFESVDCIWRWLNFAGWIAVKRQS